MTSTARVLIPVVVVAGVAGVLVASVLVGDEPRDRRSPPTAHVELAASTPPAEATVESRSTIVPTTPGPPRDSTGTTPPVEPSIDRGVLLDGLVVDDAGAPIVGATIDAVDRRRELVTSVTSGARGTFQLDLTPSITAVRARAPGFVEGGHGDLRHGAAGSIVLLPPLVLCRAATVRGVVADHRGTVSGARVRVAREGTCSSVVEELTSDGEGRFELSDALAGMHTVSATLDGVPRRCSPTQSFLLAPGQSVEVSLTLLAVHDQLTIRVLMADGSAPASRRPPSTSIYVGHDLLSVDDSATGWAPIDSPFDVVAHHGALVGRAGVAPGQRRVELLLEPEARLEGRVRWPSGDPAFHASVYFVPDGRAYPTHAVRTDHDGHFALDVPRGLGGRLFAHLDGLYQCDHVAAGEAAILVTLPPRGRVRVRITPRTARANVTAYSNVFNWSLGEGFAVPVAAGRTRIVAFDRERGLRAIVWVDVVPDATLDVPITLVPAASLRGRVVDRRGRPVLGELSVARERSVTDGAGRFSFDSLPPGRHTLSATRLGLVAAAVGAKRATLRERIIDVAQAEDLDLGDLVVELD